MTDCGKLLESLKKDHMARLRHVVLKNFGVSPLSLRARLISDRKIIECACQMVLECRDSRGGFDMERFERMKEGRL